MGNCLVTKLKSAVENENLSYLGYIKFVLKGTANNASLNVMGTGTIKFIGGKYNGSNTLEMVADTMYYLAHTNEYNTVTPDVPGGDVTILIPKYTITRIYDYGLGTPFSLEELEYSTLLVRLLLSNRNITGKISDVVGLSNIDYMSLQSVNVTGDISVLSTMPNLVNVNFTGTNTLTGDAATLGKLALTALIVPFTKNVDFSVEAFVGYNRTAGRTTGSINLKYIGKCNSTFNGAAVPDTDVDNQLSWDATTITFKGTTITA